MRMVRKGGRAENVFRVSCSVFRVPGFEFRVSGFEFRVSGLVAESVRPESNSTRRHGEIIAYPSLSVPSLSVRLFDCALLIETESSELCAGREGAGGGGLGAHRCGRGLGGPLQEAEGGISVADGGFDHGRAVKESLVVQQVLGWRKHRGGHRHHHSADHCCRPSH